MHYETLKNMNMET